MRKTAFEMAAEIIKSQCSTNMMTHDEIISALHDTYRILQSLQVAEKQGAQISDQNSGGDIYFDKYIQKNKITCLECGREF